MRSLHVLASADRRGAEVFGTQLADGLRRLGHEADVVALAPAQSPGSGLPVEVIEAFPGRRAVSELRRRARAADVVIGHGSTGLAGMAAATLGTRTPGVYRSVGDPSYWGSTLRRRLRVAPQLLATSAVVVLWPGAAASLQDRYRVRAAKIAVIPNSADPVALDPLPEPVALTELAASGAPIVALISSLTSEKRPGLAIETVAAVPGAALVIAGDGRLRPDLEAQAEALLPGRHLFLGSMPSVQHVLDRADALILLSETEGQPGVLIEAGHAGVPAVVSNVGGMSTVVLDGSTGRVVPPDCGLAERAAALRAVLDDHEAMGAAARSRCAEVFASDTVLGQWVQLLETVAGSR